ncbi:MAG TPA: hypothetical protein VFQ53_42160 [Kofleriaceae bacterium]|nr:hypothetical protein [Kofleriaceae bacterium]
MDPYGPVPRIEWSWTNDRLLTCHAGRLRMFDAEGTAVRDVGAGRYLDARWLDGGGLLAMTSLGLAERFTMHGESYGEPLPVGPLRFTHASLDARAERALLIATHGALSVTLTSVERRTVWQFREYRYNVQSEIGRTTAALSEDGARVAIGTETRAWESGRERIASGRGVLVIAIDDDETVDRFWYECARDEAPLRFAFDAGPRRRLAIAAPEREDGFGTLRLGAGEVYPRTHRGGARAVALDGRGLLAAFAYPTGVGERRLRVDYLVPKTKGPVVVEITDTLWLDPDCEPIALAFDRDSRRIACLAADGGVEVVPVP